MSNWLDRVETMMALKRCVRCGKQDAYTMNGHQRCYDCIEKARNYQRERNKKRAEQIKENQKNRYHRLKSQGLCVTCGKKPALKNGVKCKECFNTSQIYYRKYYLERSKNDSKGTFAEM